MSKTVFFSSLVTVSCCYFINNGGNVRYVIVCVLYLINITQFFLIRFKRYKKNKKRKMLYAIDISVQTLSFILVVMSRLLLNNKIIWNKWETFIYLLVIIIYIPSIIIDNYMKYYCSK